MPSHELCIIDSDADSVKLGVIWDFRFGAAGQCTYLAGECIRIWYDFGFVVRRNGGRIVYVIGQIVYVFGTVFFKSL
jgi:hypothetical protein